MIFKQVFRIAFVTFIWKNYKAWIVSTILLLFGFFLIGKIHADLLQYWQLQEEKSQIAASIIYKWIAYLGCALAYFLYHYFRPKKAPETAKETKEKRKTLEKELTNLSPNEDPFSDIRNRDTLRSRSDFILNQQADNKNDAS